MNAYYDDDPTPRRLKLMPSMDSFAGRQGTQPGRTLTEKQRTKLLRNTAIAVLRANGFSQRQVCRVFGLSKTRVNAIYSAIADRTSGRCRVEAE